MHPSFHLYRLCSANRGFQRTLAVRFQSPTSSLCRSVVYLTSSPLSRTGNKPATTANNWRWTVMNSCPLWNTHRERWGRKTLYSNCRKWRNISLGTADNQDCPKVAHCTVQLPLRGRWVSTWLFFLKTASWDKDEPVTDMLTCANQPERRCGKYQSVPGPGPGLCHQADRPDSTDVRKRWPQSLSRGPSGKEELLTYYEWVF